MKFYTITFIASISAVIGMLIVGGVFGEEWLARLYRVIAVWVVVAILCVAGIVMGILRKSADAGRLHHLGQTTPSIDRRLRHGAHRGRRHQTGRVVSGVLEPYVGAAYGGTGISQRLCTYAATLHGGNVELKALVAAKGEQYALQNLRFALQEFLTSRTDDQRVMDREVYWKQVLMSRTFGSNRN